MQTLKRKTIENTFGKINKIGKNKRTCTTNTILCNHSNDVLSESEWKKIERRCYKGQYSASGFLKKGEKLREVINNDMTYLKSVGISHKQISDKLEEITKKYQEAKKKDMSAKPIGAIHHSLDQSYAIDNLNVSCVQYRGFQNCPFENKSFKDDETCRGSCDYTITNNETNESTTFSYLIIHLINSHCFFEGSVDYRLDPKKAISILEITSTLE